MYCSAVNMFLFKARNREQEAGIGAAQIEAIISTEPQIDFKAQASIFKPSGLFFMKFAHNPVN